MNYSGAAAFRRTALKACYLHQFDMTQTLRAEVKLQFIDQFSYLPESQFGFGGMKPVASGVGVPLPDVPGCRTAIRPTRAFLVDWAAI